MRPSSRITRSLGIAVAMGTVLTLAACSSGASESGDSQSAPTGSGAEAVSIDYIHRLPDGEGMTKVSELVSQWNTDHPDIQVTATKFDGQAGELSKKLETDIAADNGPCLAQLDYGEVPTMYAKGLTEDVTSAAQQYKDNYSGAFSMMTVGDVTVGLPQDTGPLVYFYNKAEFDKLGIEVPTTLDEFKTAAATAADEGKYISAFEADEVKFWLSGQAAAAGAVWFSADNDQWLVTADSTESAVVSDFWQEMLDDKTTIVLERWGDSFSKALNDQELIGVIGAAWETPLLADSMAGTANDGQWAVAQLPDYGKGPLTGPDGGSGVAVMKGCEYPDQALEFANWLNTQVDALVSQGLVVATTTGEMKTPDAIKSFYGGQDVFKELSTANENLSPDFTYMPYFPAIDDAMKKAASAAGAGTGKVSDVFVAAQTQSVKALSDAGLPVKE